MSFLKKPENCVFMKGANAAYVKAHIFSYHYHTSYLKTHFHFKPAIIQTLHSLIP